MPDKPEKHDEDCYEVSLTLRASKNGREIINAPIHYPNTNLAVVVIVEQLAIEVMQKLGDVGKALAKQKGFEDHLKLAGF